MREDTAADPVPIDEPSADRRIVPASGRSPRAPTAAASTGGWRIRASTNTGIERPYGVGEGRLLDALLTARPALREQAEELAIRRLSRVDPAGVANDVESALRSSDIDDLGGRAGYRPGIGYVHPVDAAAEILDVLLQPYLDDLQRHAKLGMTGAAVDLAVGILHGLHRCRDGGSESLIEYSPDYADERAAEIVRQCRAGTVDLPLDDLAVVLTGWDFLFRRGPQAGRVN